MSDGPENLPGPLFALYVLLVLTLWLLPVFLGLRAARARGRSPHWMWFGLHPVSGWITFLWLRYGASPRSVTVPAAAPPALCERTALDRPHPLTRGARIAEPNKAIDLILECIDPSTIWAVDLKPAIAELRQEGPRGSDRLASLIRELFESRSEGIVYALHVAEGLEKTSALEEALSLVVSASPVTTSRRGRFTPEIEGAGRIGWTDSTHSKVTAAARQALNSADVPSAASRETPREFPVTMRVAETPVPSPTDRIVVGECESCRRAIRVRRSGLSPEMRLTCRCGHLNVIRNYGNCSACRKLVSLAEAHKVESWYDMEQSEVYYCPHCFREGDVNRGKLLDKGGHQICKTIYSYCYGISTQQDLPVSEVSQRPALSLSGNVSLSEADAVEAEVPQRPQQ